VRLLEEKKDLVEELYAAIEEVRLIILRMNNATVIFHFSQ
jgi:hypothetical protein